MSKARQSLKYGAFGFGGFVLLLVMFALVMFLMRSKWELYGNFLPYFNFESAQEHSEKVAKSRAEQRSEGRAGALALAEAGSLEDGPSWTGFRGPNRDGISHETGLLQKWPKGGPPEVYRQLAGLSYAGLVVGHGRAYTIEQRGPREAIVCYDFETGYELWAYDYEAFFSEQMGGDGPRATPTLDGDRIYALGAMGHLHCLNALTGEVLWAKQILRDNRTSNLEWGMASSPLIDEDRVIVTTSGFRGGSVIAYDKMTGDAVWKSVREQQAYTSPFEATFFGKKYVLNESAGTLNGLDAETGEKLWTFPWGTMNGNNCAQPILVGDDRIFLSSGYGQGCALIQLEESGDRVVAKQLWANKNMKNKFSASVVIGEYVYGLDESILTCLSLETGKRQWKGGRYGHGQVLYADGNLIVLGERGVLALVRATPESFQEISKFQALRGKTWNTLGLAGGRLLIRNQKEMVCYDLRASGAE